VSKPKWRMRTKPLGSQRAMARSRVRCCQVIHRRMRSMKARLAGVNQIGHLKRRPVHLRVLR
jgi:hypothetical protein